MCDGVNWHQFEKLTANYRQGKKCAALCSTKKGLHFDFLDSVLGWKKTDWQKLSDSHIWDDVQDAGNYRWYWRVYTKVYSCILRLLAGRTSNLVQEKTEKTKLLRSEYCKGSPTNLWHLSFKRSYRFSVQATGKLYMGNINLGHDHTLPFQSPAFVIFFFLSIMDIFSMNRKLYNTDTKCTHLK